MHLGRGAPSRRRRGRGVADVGLQHEITADDQRQTQPGSFQMRTHDTGERALVGERQRGVTQCLRAGDQFLGVRGPAQETEVAAAEKFGVGEERRDAT